MASVSTPSAADTPPVPAAVVRLARGRAVRLVWHNELGGCTYRVGDRFVKWNPRSTGIDLADEWARMRWLHPRHPCPRPLAFGASDTDQWLVSDAFPGRLGVGDRWRANPAPVVAAIAEGLRAFHRLPIADVPARWQATSWVTRTPAALPTRPPIDEPVLVHGDACAPNTLVGDDGRWVGHVDLLDVAVGDRWADLAVASMSLEWNYGPGWEPHFFDAYGIEPDPVRIEWYRALWHLES